MKNLINLSAREVMANAEKSRYTLVDRPLFRNLVCKKKYSYYEPVFEQGKVYGVWITQCYNPGEKKRKFFNFVAVPAQKIGDQNPVRFYIVPEDVFGEYDKTNIPAVTTLADEKYKLINDFEGFGILIPQWSVSRKAMLEYIEKEFGQEALGFTICSRIFGQSLDYKTWVCGWEIWPTRNRKKAVKYFNIYTSDFISPREYPFKLSVNRNGKQLATGWSIIKAVGDELKIMMPDKKSK